jgi:hypothetical protein
MKNRKSLVLGAAVALVTISSPAVAATLSNGSGQSCGDAVGVWHFVNNQTGGAAAGTLTATFTDGGTWTVNATTVNQNVQHFFVESTGTLVSASTNLPGRLVLSDFSCGPGPKK